MPAHFPSPPKPVANVKWAGLPGKPSPDRSAGDRNPQQEGLKDTLNK